MEKLDKDFIKQLTDETKNRFVVISTDGLGSTQIFIDRVTGIEYLGAQGFGGGLIPVLEADGKPRINDHFRK